MGRVKFGILILAVVLVSVVGGAMAVTAEETPPGEPALFEGDAVAEDGVLAPEGTTIVAVVNGSEEDDVTVETVGEYGGDGFENEKLELDSDLGDNVSFHIGNASGPKAIESPVPLESGTTHQLLTFPAGTFDADEALRVTDLSVSLDENTVLVGNQTSATVTAHLDDGPDRDVTHSVLESSNPEIASVDGLAVAGDSPGEVTITGTYAGQTDTEPFTVLSTEPFFRVEITDVPETFEPGEDVAINYSVENFGQDAGTQDIHTRC